MRFKSIRSDVILAKDSHYFDFTASGLALNEVEDKMRTHLLSYANIHSGESKHASKMQRLYDNARKDIKKCLKLDRSFALIVTGFGCTAAIKRFCELLGLYIPPKTRELYIKDLPLLPLVILGPYEHHSNELCFREGLCECVRVGLDKKGCLDVDELKQILAANKNRKIIASFSACSNVTGIKTDYKLISSLVRSYGGIVAFDLAALIAHENIDASYADALFISSHKLLGGVGGCGLLAIKKKLIPKTPSFAGGGTVEYVSRSSVRYHTNAQNREEGGTPGILELIRAGLAFKIRDKVGLQEISSYEKKLCEYFFKKASMIAGMELYARENTNRAPIFSFNIKNISPYYLASKLSYEYGIETRAGCACAGPYGHDLLGLSDDQVLSKKPGWLRVSLSYIHTLEDLDYFFSSLKAVIKDTKPSLNTKLVSK